jgi:hypothetical protein
METANPPAMKESHFENLARDIAFEAGAVIQVRGPEVFIVVTGEEEPLCTVEQPERLWSSIWQAMCQRFPVLAARETLKREFHAEEGSFLIQARCQLEWDWDAFRRLTSAMYDVAEEAKGRPSIETWIAEGFWYCDTFISGWTSHPNFPRPPEDAYRDAIELLHNLASFLFTGQNPYDDDDTLRKEAKG